MLPHIFPREVRAKPVYLSTVMSNEKDEVLGGYEFCVTTVGKSTGLKDLVMSSSRFKSTGRGVDVLVR